MSTEEPGPIGLEANDERSPTLLSSISTEMVRIYKEQFGRGPTKSWSHFAGPDTIVCLLEHTFTPVERTLREMGEHQRLREMRTFFQYASEQQFVGSVERLSGRRVRAFISGIDTHPDVACEVFVLEPEVDAPGVIRTG